MQEQTSYNSEDMAKYLIAKSKELGVGSINMTKLQKLLYISYGILLAVKGRVLTNEQPKAWPYGPVFPRVRKQLLKCEFNKITKDSFDKYGEIDSDTDLRRAVELTLKSFGQYSASYLTEWSHATGSPWWTVIEKEKNGWNTPIPIDYIIKYFKEYLNRFGIYGS